MNYDNARRCKKTNKVSHINENDALKAAESLYKHNPDCEYEVYPCGYCGFYHVGRPRKIVVTLIGTT